MPGKEQVYLLAEQVERLRASLQAADPYLLAARTGTIYHPTEQENGEFRFQLWGQEVKLAFPAFQGLDPMTGMEIPTHLQALLLYYFTTCDGVPPGGRWISFSELPNGRFYNQAFQGYTGLALARAFHDDSQVFMRAAESLAGTRMFFGDLAYAFPVLPHVSLLSVVWLGDEDFPPSYQILFDANAGHHLPTDACAIIGSYLTRQLINAKQDQ